MAEDPPSSLQKSDEARALEENMAFWLDNIRQQFPKRHTGVYTIPAIHINRVPYDVLTFADESVYVPQTPCDDVLPETKRSSRRKTKPSSRRKAGQLPLVHQSDVKTDAAQQRVLFCLTKMAEREKQAMVMLSQLQFGDYLGDKAYAAATALLPQSKNLRRFAADDQSSGKNLSRGDFDILIINRDYGLIVCEIKTLRDKPSEEGGCGDFLNILKKRIKQAVEQMTKARLMLRHLVSDLAPDLTIRVSLVLPNVTRQDIMQALCGDSDLKTSLGQCLGSRPLPADLADLCLCSDDLSHCATPWDVTPDVLEKMSRWWHKLVDSSGSDPRMDVPLYDNLLARFCGPATTVTVPCVTRPRMSLKTLPEAVSEAGEIFAQITLHHHQVELLQDMARHLDNLHALYELNAADAAAASSSRRLFVCGPPGTGKSVVLLLAAREWLRRGHDVHVVSTWNESRLASYLLEHLLLASLHALAKPGQTLGKVRLHEFDFLKAHKMLEAVQSLVKAAKAGNLFVVCDEAGPDYGRPRFPDFCEKLWARVPGLHLWAASCQYRHCSSYWRSVALTHALRSPPVVVREVAQAEEISDGDVYRYSESNLPSPTDGPPVKFICHEGHAHTGAAPHDCEQCGREVGDFLNGLVVVADSRPGSSTTTTSSSDETSNVTSASSSSESQTPSTVATTATRTAAKNTSVSARSTAPGLRFSDVLVLCQSRDVGDQSGLLAGMRQRKVPVRPMGREDARDLVKATQDVVWVAHWTNVLGLERKVVVYVGVKDRQSSGTMYDRLHCLSRCTAQLVWVYPSKSGIGPVSGHTRVWGELKVQGQKETESPADSRETCSQQRHASHMFTATPMFCPTWHAVHSVTCDGGAFNHGDSDVVLYVPPDAVGRHVTAAVHAGSCANLAQVQRLMGLATGSVYIASPLVELWAGAHFRFQQPVRIRLPHYLPTGHDPTKVYVICLERSKVGQPHLFRHLKPAMSRGHNLARGHLSSGLTTAEHVSHILSPAERLVSQEDEQQGVSEEEVEGAEKTEETEMVEVGSDGHLYVTTVQLRGGYACVYQGGGVTGPTLMVLATALYAQTQLGHLFAKVTVYIWDQRLAIKDFKAEILEGRGECVVQQTRLRLMNILTGSSLHCRLEIVGSSIERWQHCRRHGGTLGLPDHQNLNLDELMVNPDMTGSYWSSSTSPFTFSWLLETRSPQPNPPLHPGPWPFHCVVDISHVTKNASPKWCDMVGSEVVTRLGITVKTLAEYTTALTTGSRAEKATEKGDNQAEQEPDAEMMMKSPRLSKLLQEGLRFLKDLLAELYEDTKEHTLKWDKFLKRKKLEVLLKLRRKVIASQRSSSGMLDWKVGRRDPFDIYPRKNLAIHHHPEQGRLENEGTFLAKNETEPHINMYPTAKDFTLEESQEAWIQWVNNAFPDLHGTQFWLPVCAQDFASVHCTEEQSTLDTSQQQAAWYNSDKNDLALKKVLLCLKERSEAKDEVMFVLSQMYFGQKSGEPCYSAAADYLPPPHSVPPAPLRNWTEGDFDLLIIHQRYGLVVCEVKAFGDNSSKSGKSQQDVDSKIRSKLKEAILQVDRAEAVLSHLVSDIVPGLRITKTIAFPNLRARQLQQALAEDPRSTEALCRCLGAADVAGITDLCLTCDQLCVPGTDFDNWWLPCVVGSGSGTEISFDDYQRLLARFCGPAVTVTVPCLSPPRLSLKTLEQPSSSTSLCHAVITLFPEQVHLLNTATPRVFLAGPPGTGKSLVLQLKATEWLRCGCDVFMVRSRRRGGAESYLTYYLLQQTIETQLAKTGKSGQLHHFDYDFDDDDDDIEEAVTDLSVAAKERPLYVIVDTIGSPSLRYEGYNIKRFLDKLLARVPDVHCWAAGHDLEFAPSNWQVQHFTRPIPFPKFVEMEAADFHPGILEPYSQRGQHDTTPGPPVQWFLLPKHDHRRFIDYCDTCGELVVRFLQDLLAGASENTTASLTSITSTKRDTTSPSLRYRDVLIVRGRDDHINLEKALRNWGIPLQDMTHYITEDMVTSNRDEDLMMSTNDLQGLERKVVVIVGETQPDKYVGVLHCTSQLVFISQTDLPEPWPIVEGRGNTDTDWKYAERHFVPEKKPVSHINIYQTAKEFKFEESRDLWIRWVEESFPDLFHHTYFWLPARADLVHNIQDPLTNWEEEYYASISSQQCPPQDNDSALQRVLLCLKKISDAMRVVMFVLCQLYFGQNSGEPCYSAAAVYLPPPDSVPPAPLRNWEEGDFDLLIIHRTYGLVVCEVKAFGDNSSKSGMSQQDVDSKIRSKLKEAILQVDRAEAVLSHLVSDIVPGLRITKTIAFPNLTGRQIQQALAEDLILTEDLCRCLEAADLVSVVGLCLCSEQLYVYGAQQNVPTELWEWWLRCVVRSGSQTKMTFGGYETLVARFCGPAVTVTIPCISPPNLCLKILNQPSPSTTQCSYAVITLFPEQVHLLNMTSPRVILAGPPGTGKTVVLQLKATEWLRCGRDVFLVCTSDRCAACYRMYYLLQQTIETQLAPTVTSGQLHLLEYRFRADRDVHNAVKDLSQAATGGVLHVIADEMDSKMSYHEQMFRDKLLTQVPRLHFWAASNYAESTPSSWKAQNLTRPIRFSETYSPHGEYESPRGPPVQRFSLPRHKGSHRSTRPINRCVTCGDHVAKILMDVLAGIPGQGNITTSTAIAPTRSDTTSVRLQYRDVLVLPSIHVRYFMDLETGLRKAGIPVRCMRRDNIENIVTAREDKVVVADEEDVRGLERKVVVVIVDELEDVGHLAISRCTSQLVYITFRGSSDLREYHGDCDKASDDESQREQNKEKSTDETVAKSHVTKSEDIEILTSSTMGTDPLYFSAPHPTIPDVSEASLPPNAKPDRSPDECRAGEAAENSDDITPPPGFCCVGDTLKRTFDVKSDENSEDDSEVDEKKATEENQKDERKKLETCSKKGVTNTEMQSIIPFSADSQCCLLQYKITVDLKKTISLKAPQHVRMPNRLLDECDQRKATEKSKDITSSPIFSYRWQNIQLFSAEGGRLRGEGSDVVLTVPSGAVAVNTNVTIHTSVCVNDVYIKHKLKLAATETIVSPLAEFWAGPDFHFKKHVEITLPTCLPSDYDVDLLHVYCITRGGQEGEITVKKIQRLKDMTQTPDKEALEVYFYISVERQVEVMTSHFSGYVCTYCGLCQNIGLEVYASHRFDNESVQVSIIAQFWDKLHISDFRQWKPELNSFTVVLSTTFQIKKMLKPAELQVDLIIDDEQKTMWEFKPMPAPANTFCLNWGEIACVNSTNHPAVKYTDLGPFSPGWKLKSKASENGVMPSTLEAFLLVSHLKTQESKEPLWSSAPCQLDVQPLNGKEKCVSNGTSGNCPVININNVNGDVTFAQQLLTQKTENVLYIMENNQSTSQTMLKRLEQPVDDTSQLPTKEQQITNEETFRCTVTRQPQDVDGNHCE